MDVWYLPVWVTMGINKAKNQNVALGRRRALDEHVAESPILGGVIVAPRREAMALPGLRLRDLESISRLYTTTVYITYSYTIYLIY